MPQNDVLETMLDWARFKDANGVSNYEAFVSELNRIRCAMGSYQGLFVVPGRGRYRRGVQGNMLEAAIERMVRDRGMRAEYYPILLRIAIMDYPQLAMVDRPHGHRELDSQQGAAQLRVLAFRISGRRPELSHWRKAAAYA